MRTHLFNLSQLNTDACGILRSQSLVGLFDLKNVLKQSKSIKRSQENLLKFYEEHTKTENMGEINTHFLFDISRLKNENRALEDFT